MDPEAAILEWIGPASRKAGADGDLWIEPGGAVFDRREANPDYDDKIFNPQLYGKIKVDDQFYFNNPGVYLIIDNTVKAPSGSKDLMRLEIQYERADNSTGVWVLQPYTGAHEVVKITKLDENEWANSDDTGSIKRSPSNWDINYLTEYLGNARFRPLNWTQFPDTLL
jgi:hypothetical protein